jgi:hypothetical protein
VVLLLFLWKRRRVPIRLVFVPLRKVIEVFCLSPFKNRVRALRCVQTFCIERALFVDLDRDLPSVAAGMQLIPPSRGPVIDLPLNHILSELWRSKCDSNLFLVNMHPAVACCVCVTPIEASAIPDLTGK